MGRWSLGEDELDAIQRAIKFREEFGYVLSQFRHGDIPQMDFWPKVNELWDSFLDSGEDDGGKVGVR